MSLRYQIFEWVDPRTSQGVWSSTYENLGNAGQATADIRVLYVRDQAPSMWTLPHARKLAWQSDSNCKGLYEIRFKANGLQQRPMGYFGPHPGIFTFVVWATHKGSHWKPREFCRIAKERWQEIQASAAEIRPVQFD